MSPDTPAAGRPSTPASPNGPPGAGQSVPAGGRPPWLEDPRFSLDMLSPGQRYTAMVLMLLAVTLLIFGTPGKGGGSGQSLGANPAALTGSAPAPSGTSSQLTPGQPAAGTSAGDLGTAPSDTVGTAPAVPDTSAAVPPPDTSAPPPAPGAAGSDTTPTSQPAAPDTTTTSSSTTTSSTTTTTSPPPSSPGVTLPSVP